MKRLLRDSSIDGRSFIISDIITSIWPQNSRNERVSRWWIFTLFPLTLIRLPPRLCPLPSTLYFRQSFFTFVEGFKTSVITLEGTSMLYQTHGYEVRNLTFYRPKVRNGEEYCHCETPYNRLRDSESKGQIVKRFRFIVFLNSITNL